jgi:hypothetical protein
VASYNARDRRHHPLIHLGTAAIVAVISNIAGLLCSRLSRRSRVIEIKFSTWSLLFFFFFSFFFFLIAAIHDSIRVPRELFRANFLTCMFLACMHKTGGEKGEDKMVAAEVLQPGLIHVSVSNATAKLQQENKNKIFKYIAAIKKTKTTKC